MKNYLAPMEGVTNWVYRNAYHDCFYPMDKYFTPFITAKPNKRLSSKEIKEVSPETNGLYVPTYKILPCHSGYCFCNKYRINSIDLTVN